MSAPENFKTFCYDRVRLATRGYNEVMNNRVTLKELLQAYNRWIVESKAKKMTLETFTKLCEDTFGDSRGQHVYAHLRVFIDEEDLEEFETNHKAIQTNTLIYPSTETAPSEQIANSILNSENKVAWIRGLIEDKRALSFEVDELEKKVATLEKYERHTNAFIYNLIKRQGDAYQKATPPH